MKTLRILSYGWILALVLSACTNKNDKISGYPELDAWAQDVVSTKTNILGFPCNMNIELERFYTWYVANGLENVMLNNAGDPFKRSSYKANTTQFECEVVQFFAPFYGFNTDNTWGLVTFSGTDGNNHGIYFGVNYLQNTFGNMPAIYVSDEAHYSVVRLADIQNLDIHIIKSDSMGRMIPEELEKELDTTRPCLVVYAFGSTFRGAIDNIDSLNAVLDRHPEMPAFRHVDAALFGGYLPFTQYRDLLDCNQHNYQSIAVSGHKFFGMDEPAGLFITTKEVYDKQSKYQIAYLNNDMRMINCSRSATTVLKFWWLMKQVGEERWKEQATAMLANTAYLKQQLDAIGWPCWVNEYSNTVFFRRPAQEIVEKYTLPCNYDERFGGELAHIVVMQHVTKDKIDQFIADIK